jgi:hypothetical protein
MMLLVLILALLMTAPGTAAPPCSILTTSGTPLFCGRCRSRARYFADGTSEITTICHQCTVEHD